MKKLMGYAIAILVLVAVNTTVQAQQIKIVPARLYGAIPNDGHNDKPALKYLIRVVSAKPDMYILLEPGKYDVKKLKIDYEILEDMGRTTETVVPEGYVKMFYIFLIKKDQVNNTDIALK